jgi:hypothetical protein
MIFETPSSGSSIVNSGGALRDGTYPPTQKHCHPQGILEGEILDAIDEKADMGDYSV